jgi:hypothetical protein
VTPEEIALLDGHPFLPPGVEPWLRPIGQYLRRPLKINGERLDEDEPVRQPKRSGGARHAIGAR